MAEGSGRDLAAQRADLVGSGGGGRRGVAVFAFWAWLGRGPAMREVVWVGFRGGKQFVWAAFGGPGGGRGFAGLCAGAVCGPLGGVGVAWGVGLHAVAVCGTPGVGDGEGCSVGGSVVGVCGCLACRRAMGRARWWVCVRRVGSGGGRGRGGYFAGGCVVPVYVSACSGALVWSVVGRVVWRRSLPSSAAAAEISQTSVCIWCTFWSVVGRGNASSGLRPTRRKTLWMAWYPQVRECCGLVGGSFRVSGPALTCVWALGMVQIQDTFHVDGQRRWIHWARQSMASARW